MRTTSGSKGFMGDHVDIRGGKRAKVREHDELARRRRATFKQYLRDIEEDFLEEELEAEDPVEQNTETDQDD